MLYDITRELFSAPVYPGDPPPALTRLTAIKEGAAYNLSAFSACCHTGTHLDAPLHCVEGGSSIGELPLTPLIGPCYVVTLEGQVTEETAAQLLTLNSPRLLLRWQGRPVFTASGAHWLARGGLLLIGTDGIALSQDEEEEWAVHRAFCERGIPILEGLDLKNVPDGRYTLMALPLKLQGADGAPVRAVLLSTEGEV